MRIKGECIAWLNTYAGCVLILKHIDGREHSFTFDENDLILIASHQWTYASTGYAVTRISVNGKHSTRALHAILNPMWKFTDHVNRNKSDNRRANLRECTAHQNQMNKLISKNNKSGYVGVCLEQHVQDGKPYPFWRAFWSEDGKLIKKVCKSKKEAIELRISMVKKHYGEFSSIN